MGAPGAGGRKHLLQVSSGAGGRAHTWQGFSSLAVVVVVELLELLALENRLDGGVDDFDRGRVHKHGREKVSHHKLAGTMQNLITSGVFKHQSTLNISTSYWENHVTLKNISS